MSAPAATSIVMVHGAFCGAWSFDAFRAPFEAAGLQVITPDLRGHAPTDPPGAVTGVSMSDYAADIAAVCARLPAPPLLLGHSMGGLVAQMAARRCAVRGLALLAPSPPWGVGVSSLEEAATAFGVHLLSPFSSGAISPDRSLMRAYSLDRLAKPEREAAIAQLRPESAVAVRETLNWWLDPFMTTSLGPGPLGAPSLVIVGERDVVHSPATCQAVAGRIGAQFRVMAGMSHWLMGEPGWKGVAEAVLAWAGATVSPSA